MSGALSFICVSTKGVFLFRKEDEITVGATPPRQLRTAKRVCFATHAAVGLRRSPGQRIKTVRPLSSLLNSLETYQRESQMPSQTPFTPPESYRSPALWLPTPAFPTPPAGVSQTLHTQAQLVLLSQLWPLPSDFIPPVAGSSLFPPEVNLFHLSGPCSNHHH